MPVKTDIEKTLGYALHSSAFLMKQAIKQLIQQHNISTTPEAFFILNLIPAEGIEQHLLISKTHKDKAAITRLLDQLTRENWIIRRVVKENKRKCIIRISEEGENIKKELNLALTQISQQMIKGIPSEDLKVCSKVLHLLAENLDELIEQ